VIRDAIGDVQGRGRDVTYMPAFSAGVLRGEGEGVAGT
jgi:hypothetical protein